MGRTFTAFQIETRVRKLGTYENIDGVYESAYDSPRCPASATLLTYIDVAHAHAWNLWSDTDEEWNLTRSTVTTVAASASYTLPSDFHKLRSVEIAYDSSVSTSGFRPLVRATVDDDSYVGSGDPVAYRLVGSGTIELLPAPQDSRSLRIGYCPSAPTISSRSGSIPGDDGFDEVVVFRTLIQARDAEDKDAGNFERRLADAETRFRDSIRRRDRASPRRLRDPRASQLPRRGPWRTR